MCQDVPSDPPADRRDEYCSSAAVCGRKSEAAISDRKVEMVPGCGQPGTEGVSS